ncbi:MAG: ECF transporter S component [Brevefilum sp.]|jgi:energy-coupling factor transport system substrate-specific component
MKFSTLRSLSVDLIVFLLGCLSLLAPFIFPQTRLAGASQASYPIMVSLIILLCVLIIIFESQAHFLDSKMIAFLGVLIAINAGLRFLENAIPGPAGFSPIFFLIILVGYFFGSRVGFLMGAMTMFISGLITGGIGPWLPGQMITAGWVGQSASSLRFITRKFNLQGKASEIILLSTFGAVWGLLFGLVMNLWFWPFLSTSPELMWLPKASLGENLGRYFAYYLATSLVWDVTRSIGNVLIISALASSVIKIFQRFHIRFAFHHAQRMDT